MSTIEEEFDWSFLGAVIVISIACFALIISVAYYCWLYDVVSSVKYGVLAICGVENKKTARRRRDLQILPISSRQPNYPTFDRTNSENIELHVSTRVPQRPKQHNGMKRSNFSGYNSPQNGTQRPNTANKRTRQRAVNIAIHELKSHTHDQRESPPVKPIKSETVKAYVKSSGVSTSSVVDTYSSTTISENIDSEHETLAIDSESDVGFKKIYNETVNKRGGMDSETTKESTDKHTSQDKAESYRTRKWSQINAKLVRKEPQILQLADQMMHKPGRSSRAVAPYKLQNSESHEQTSSDRVDGTGRRGQMDAGLIYEVLQALRKSGDLGTNPVDRPVSRYFVTESDHRTKNSEQLISSVNSLKQFLSMAKETGPPEDAARLKENSSASDEVKSSSDTDSSLIFLSSSAKFMPSPASNQHKIGQGENERSNSISNVTPPQFQSGETMSDKTQLEHQLDAKKKPTLPDANIEEMLQNIDPSKQVFGQDHSITADIDKRESLVRRIDSLFCSTTPSSMGSVVSENVYEEQKSHNMEDELNDLRYSSKTMEVHDSISSSPSLSASDNVSNCHSYEIPQSVFLTEPNVYEVNQKIKAHNDKNSPVERGKQCESEGQNNVKTGVRHSSSSSFNSTTLPSVTSDDVYSTSTAEMTSEGDDDPGRLKFFH